MAGNGALSAPDLVDWHHLRRAVRVVDTLDDDQARTVLDAALAWGHKQPRKAALERLLLDGEDGLVQKLAGNDPDTSIRRWADNQLGDKATQGNLFD